mgnify:CR=1 FL=1
MAVPGVWVHREFRGGRADGKRLALLPRREIIVEAVNPCPFDNDNCMCQFCETPCNNGLNCSDCAHEGKTVHDVLLCTGFNGSMEQYTENWKRKQMAKLGGERE